MTMTNPNLLKQLKGTTKHAQLGNHLIDLSKTIPHKQYTLASCGSYNSH
jgi:hypothetical protein